MDAPRTPMKYIVIRYASGLKSRTSQIGRSIQGTLKWTIEWLLNERDVLRGTIWGFVSDGANTITD